MKIKVYNENGIVRIVRVTDDGVERTMFSSVADGEVAIIDVEIAGFLNSISG